MKLLVPIAVIIVLIGLVYAGFLVGRPVGAAKQKREQKSVDPQLHDQLGDFVLDLIAPTDNVDQITILPEPVRKEAARLAGQVRKARRVAR